LQRQTKLLEAQIKMLKEDVTQNRVDLEVERKDMHLKFTEVITHGKQSEIQLSQKLEQARD